MHKSSQVLYSYFLLLARRLWGLLEEGPPQVQAAGRASSLAASCSPPTARLPGALPQTGELHAERGALATPPAWYLAP